MYRVETITKWQYCLNQHKSFWNSSPFFFPYQRVFDPHTIYVCCQNPHKQHIDFKKWRKLKGNFKFNFKCNILSGSKYLCIVMLCVRHCLRTGNNKQNNPCPHEVYNSVENSYSNINYWVSQGGLVDSKEQLQKLRQIQQRPKGCANKLCCYRAKHYLQLYNLIWNL